MNIISYILLFVTLPVGLTLFFQKISITREIYYGKEKSLKKIIITALLLGISCGLMFFSVLMIAGIADRTYQWSAEMLLFSTAFCLIIGVIMFLGALWSFFVVGKYREILFKKLVDMFDKNKK